MNNEATIIIEWVRENCLQDAPDGRLTSESPLLGDGGLDSLEVVRLVNFLEGKFAIAVDVDELVPENFETVEHVVAMVQRIRAMPNA